MPSTDDAPDPARGGRARDAPSGGSDPTRNGRGATGHMHAASCDDHDSCLRARVRHTTLQSEAALLELNRDALKAEIAELKDEIATLERTIRAKDHRRQEVIDEYEARLEEKHQANLELRQQLEAAED